MRSTFKVFFYLKKAALKSDGTASIMARVTIDGDFVAFSTKLFALPDIWDAKNQCLMGRSSDVKDINAKLADIAARLNHLYRTLQERDLYVTAENVKNHFLGITLRQRTLLTLFDKHLEDVEKMVGISVTPATLQKYRIAHRHVSNFLMSKYRLSDISLLEINHSFLTDFEMYLRTTANCCANTTAKFMQTLRTIVLIAINNGWIIVNPFSKYKIHFEKVERQPLSKLELKSLLQKQFCSARLTAVRDIFIFSCFTGLPYADLKKLSADEIVADENGKLWIQTHRVKTNTSVRVPLLDIPLMILDKYKGLPHGRMLPIPSNQKLNAYLKEIGDLCGIKRDLHCHLARHTFATTITL